MRAACPVATAVRGSAARRACPAVQDWTGPPALAERLECRACRGLSGSLAPWDLQVAAMLCPCSYSCLCLVPSERGGVTAFAAYLTHKTRHIGVPGVWGLRMRLRWLGVHGARKG